MDTTVSFDICKRNILICRAYAAGIKTSYLANKYDVSVSLINTVTKQHERNYKFSKRKHHLYSDYMSHEYTKKELSNRYSLDENVIKKYVREIDAVEKYKSGVPIKTILDHYGFPLDEFERFLYKNGVESYFLQDLTKRRDKDE